MLYATHEYYAGVYGGNIIPDVAFKKMIRKASQYINAFTFGRITEANVEKYPTLPDCACEMAEAIYNTVGSTGKAKEKKSENTDGYSVSYVTELTDGTPAEETLRRKLYAIARVYLQNTGLLYCGVDVC